MCLGGGSLLLLLLIIIITTIISCRDNAAANQERQRGDDSGVKEEGEEKEQQEKEKEIMAFCNMRRRWPRNVFVPLTRREHNVQAAFALMMHWSKKETTTIQKTDLQIETKSS